MLLHLPVQGRGPCPCLYPKARSPGMQSFILDLQLQSTLHTTTRRHSFRFQPVRHHRLRPQRSRHRLGGPCAATVQDDTLVARYGDQVTVEISHLDSNGAANDPKTMTFTLAEELPAVGPGQQWVKALFENAQGMAVGQQRAFNVIHQDYSPHFVFDVPLDHPEIVRLSKEAGDGGAPQTGDASTLNLKEGDIVTLQNQTTARVDKVTDESITLDGNHNFQATAVKFQVELKKIER